MGLLRLFPKFRAAPHKEAGAFTERLCIGRKIRERWGISAFPDCRVGEKDPVKAKDDLHGNVLVKK
jgi:hypothetical protein